MGHIAEIESGLVEFSLQLIVGGLLVAQGVLDFVDYLVCALQLLEGVLMGQLFPADLLAE